MQWCQERVQWDQEQNQILFSDESQFWLWAHDGRRRRRVRRKSGEMREINFASIMRQRLFEDLWYGVLFHMDAGFH